MSVRFEDERLRKMNVFMKNLKMVNMSDMIKMGYKIENLIKCIQKSQKSKKPY